ncbi:hypothetical protein C8R43DRAFT_167665 [Mycena crocata]|nr:hypothetical protein C8R43DRAFT_167665 [Mycena crocata]
MCGTGEVDRACVAAGEWDGEERVGFGHEIGLCTRQDWGLHRRYSSLLHTSFLLRFKMRLRLGYCGVRAVRRLVLPNPFWTSITRSPLIGFEAPSVHHRKHSAYAPQLRQPPLHRIAVVADMLVSPRIRILLWLTRFTFLLHSPLSLQPPPPHPLLAHQRTCFESVYILSILPRNMNKNVETIYARNGATNPAFSIASPVRLGRTGPNASNSSVRARGGSITSVSSSSSSYSSSTSRTRSSSNTSLASSPRRCPGSRLAPRAKQGESTTQEIRRFFGVGVSHPKEKPEKSAKVPSPRAAKDTNKVDGTDKVKVLKAPFVVPLRYATPAAAARAAARAAASAVSAPGRVSAHPAGGSPIVKNIVPAPVTAAAPRKSPACAIVKTSPPSTLSTTPVRARISPRHASSRIPRFIGRVALAATHDKTRVRPQCSSVSCIPVLASKIQGKNKTKTLVKAAPGPSTPVCPPSPPAYSASASVSVSAPALSAEAAPAAPASCPHCGCGANTPAPPTPAALPPTPPPSPISSAEDVVVTVEEKQLTTEDTATKQIAEGIESSVPVKEKQYASVKTQTDKLADGPTPTPEHRQAISDIFGGSKSLTKKPATLMESIKKTQAEDPLLAQIKTRLSDPHPAYDDKAAPAPALARAALLAQKCRAVEVKCEGTGTPAPGPSVVLRSRRTGVQDENTPAIEPENELQRAYARRGLGALSLPTPPATPAVIKRFPLRQVDVNASNVPIVIQEDGTSIAESSCYSRGAGKEDDETPFGKRKVRRVVVPAYDNDKVFRDARTQLEIQGLRAQRRVGGGGCEQVAVGGSDADEGKRGLSLIAVGLMERKKTENPIDKM